MKAIEKAQRINQERRDAGQITLPNHNWIVKAKLKPNSLITAIAAKCFECFGGTEKELPDPGWKDFIRTCTAPDCALFSHRPYQKSLTDDEIDDESHED